MAKKATKTTKETRTRKRLNRYCYLSLVQMKTVQQCMNEIIEKCEIDTKVYFRNLPFADHSYYFLSSLKGGRHYSNRSWFVVFYTLYEMLTEKQKLIMEPLRTKITRILLNPALDVKLTIDQIESNPEAVTRRREEVKKSREISIAQK